MGSGSQELIWARLTRTESNSLHFQLPVSHEQLTCKAVLATVSVSKYYINYM